MITKEVVGKIRDELLLHAKQEKEPGYRAGYVDGVLDTFNEIAKRLEHAEAVPQGNT